MCVHVKVCVCLNTVSELLLYEWIHFYIYIYSFSRDVWLCYAGWGRRVWCCPRYNLQLSQLFDVYFPHIIFCNTHICLSCCLFSSELMFLWLLEPESLTDPLLQLISLQKATGSWEMDSSMAKVLEKSDDELAKLMPVGVKSGLILIISTSQRATAIIESF